MKSCFLAEVADALIVAAVVGLLAAPIAAETEAPVAEETAEAQEGESPAAGSEESGDALEATDSEATAEEIAPEAESFHQTVLGPAGRDEQGRAGRLHTVASGDTLWDISDAYLGTPWAWPSIWHDNDDVSNPDLIHPGDILWITPEEMRPVTDQEAAALLAGGDDLPPAAMELDGMPGEPAQRPRFTFSEVQTTGFVTDEALEGSATIVDSPSLRTLLAGNDEVVIGLGAGEVSQGDRMTIFRTEERVRAISGQPIGWSTVELGWLEVTKVHAESATAMVKLSVGDMQRGDRVRPFEMRDTEIEVLDSPEVEGHVVHTPDQRLTMGAHDVVYLDRGRNDGLDVGSPLEIYRPLGRGVDAVTGEVELPDEVVAKLLVVETGDATSVALVTHATSDLTRGDRFRGSDDIGAP
ncbi:MAG: LysM peptidoglycan-binding domain-containing protein [Myxococcota bacterium]|nr:LysM peptidoglycan-binding domain-containing protein [Myxococcota bacterium]